MGPDRGGHMIELPEAAALATAASTLLVGRTVVAAEAGHTPHTFT